MRQQEGLDLDDIITWNLVRAARLTGRRLESRLVQHGLNPVTFGILAYLSVSSPITQADLARTVLIRPQSIAAVLDVLEDRELVRRVGSRSRGRRNPIELTESGRTLLEIAWPAVRTTNELGDLGLSAEESHRLNEILVKLLRASDGEPESPSPADLAAF